MSVLRFAVKKTAFQAVAVFFFILIFGSFFCLESARAEEGTEKSVSESGGSSQGDILDGELDNSVNPQQLPDSTFIYDVAIADLAAADTFYDGQTVRVLGEAVGDPLHADILGEEYWVALSSEDNLNVVSICLTKKDREKIDDFGRYGVRGTMLQVRGTFHLVCSEHQGESDIHAAEVSVVASSQKTPDVVDISSFAQGVYLLAGGLVLTFVFYWLRERRR